MYRKRKFYTLGVLKKEMTILNNKRRFIEGVNSGEISLRNKTKQQIIDMLKAMKFDPYPSKDQDEEGGGEASNFSYLLGMPLWSLTKEKITELQNKAD